MSKNNREKLEQEELMSEEYIKSPARTLESQ